MPPRTVSLMRGNGTVSLEASRDDNTPTSEAALYVEGRIKTGNQAVLLRLEGFNVFNHGNLLGRAQTVYSDGVAANPTFGQLVAVGTLTNALPSLANIDPPRMLQFQIRYQF